MTNRVFIKDQNAIDTATSYHYNDTTVVVAEFNDPLLLRVLHWENISGINQGLMTTALGLLNYTFDHDE